MPTIRLMNATTGHSTARGSDHLGHPSRTLEPSKTESYLLSLLTDDITPTLRDLERLKPPEHPDSHLKDICHSFSNDQLRSFTQQYALSLGSKLRKASYAKAIVEKAWQWPSLRELKRAQSGRTEVTSLALALSPSELFILLGKNGSDLFQLSREYNVYASVKRNPLSLYLEGSRDSVKGAEEYIDCLRKRWDIVEDTFDTPSKHPVPQDAFHSISRLSGAFLEKTEDQKVRICLSPGYIVLTLQVTCPSQASLEYHVG
ncbi:hypothetical protein EDB84DRAFT_1530353 [Lactarius hengduanensis]|nr:hypothetical protein EDB84DRAFT_1530353 [Lactarius hengduanensis]